MEVEKALEEEYVWRRRIYLSSKLYDEKIPVRILLAMCALMYVCGFCMFTGITMLLGNIANKLRYVNPNYYAIC